MGLVDELKTALLKQGRLRISIPFLTYEMRIDGLLSEKSVEDRIARLAEIQDELEGAVTAVSDLKDEAIRTKDEANSLRSRIDELEKDKSAAEKMLEVPEESFSRLLSRANSKARLRGIVEGSCIGFLTGCDSSMFVWYVTNP